MLAFLKSEFQKEGFKSWITVYLFATLTLLAVQYNWASELVKFVSFVYFALIFLSQIEGSECDDDHMHVFFDLIFGLGIASLFFYFELYAHAVVVFAITLLDVFFTKRQKEKTKADDVTGGS